MCLHAAGCYSAKRSGVLDWFGNDEADDSNRHLDEHGQCHCGHYRCINARASYLWLNLQHRIARGAIEKDRNIMNSLPLNGLTVVSLEQAVAAPFATRQLADLGRSEEHTSELQSRGH